MKTTARINVGFTRETWLAKPHQIDLEIRVDKEIDGNALNITVTDADISEIEACLLGEYACEFDDDRIALFADDATEEFYKLLEAWEKRGAWIDEQYDAWGWNKAEDDAE